MNESGTLHLLALFVAKPGKESELRDLLESLVVPTREEAGCISYRLMEDRENPSRFVMVEEWVDTASLERHFETEHLVNAIERFPDLIEGELDLRRLRLVR